MPRLTDRALKDRAVHLVLDHQSEQSFRTATLKRVAKQLGVRRELADHQYEIDYSAVERNPALQIWGGADDSRRILSRA